MCIFLFYPSLSCFFHDIKVILYMRSYFVFFYVLFRAMVQNDEDKVQKQKLLKRAAEKHQNLYRDAMNGKGIDRHLFALYVACKGFGYVSYILSIN